jgi:hypothetical protein
MNGRARGLWLGLAGVAVLSGTAMGSNVLVLSGILADSDAVAIGYDGPNAPAANTFVYDLYTISVDLMGTYQFDLDSEALTLMPWVGVYANNFNALDYWSPQALVLATASPGDTASVSMVLTPGVYQVVAASVDWVEEVGALDDGPYTMTVTGPRGSNVELIPTPGAGVLAMVGLTAGLRRRR